MARLGISSVSVYRATKGFSAIGLDRDVAELYGVQSTLGGLSMRDVARILLTNHRFVLEEGLGKYQWIDQVCFQSKISKFFLIDFVCICLFAFEFLFSIFQIHFFFHFHFIFIFFLHFIFIFFISFS